MKKIIYALILMLPLTVNALDLTGLYSRNVLVYDIDEDIILYEKNYQSKTSIASLTKLMTVLVALENIDNLEKKITITYDMFENVPDDAATIGLEVGDVVTYKDLLYASMISSGADATEALAISVLGSDKNFVKKMNEKATELGMNHTHYNNVTGLLASNHYSTLEDLLTLIKYALKNDTFKSIFTTKNYKTSNGIKLESTLDKYNEYLDYDLSYVIGDKTGYEEDAGLCLLALINIDGETIITITTKIKNDPAHNKNIVDLNTMYERINSSFKRITVYKKNDVLKTITTKYGKNNIEILAEKDITKFVEDNFNKDLVKIAYQGKNNIPHNTKIGSKLGTITVYYDEYPIYQKDVILNKKINFSLWKWLISHKLLIALLIIMIIYRKNLIILCKNIKKRLL